MLSAKADDEGGSPIKRKSMLSKTIKAIGKVKPKFKKKGPKMELMESVDELDFELSDLERSDNENSDDDDDDDDNNEEEIPPIQEEEGKLQEQVSKEEQEEEPTEQKVDQEDEQGVKESETPPVNAPDDKEKSEDSKRHSKRRTVERNGSSSSSKPRSSRRDSRAPDPKEDMAATPTTPSVRKRTSRAGSDNLTSLSPVPQKMEGHHPEVPGLSRKRSIQRRSTPKSPMPSHLASPKASSSGDESLGRNTPTSQSRHRKVDQNLLVSPKISSHLLVQIPTESQNSPSAEEKEGEIDNSLRRCSKAFAEDDAMGGYFAKIQDLKTKSEQDDPDSAEPEASNPGKDEKSGKHHFKPSKNIRKLFGLKRSHSKDGTKSSSPNDKSHDDDADNQDEASKLMKELSSMLTPTMGEHTFARAHSARQVRTTHVHGDDDDDDDDDDDNDSTPGFFPDYIPTTKKTSLSDIRRSVQEMREERAGRGAPNRQLNHRKQDSYRRRQSNDASQKEDTDDKPTSSRKMSSTNLAADGGIDEADKEKSDAVSGPSEESSEHRRSKHRMSRRSSTEHSKSDGRTTPNPEQNKSDDEPEIAEANSDVQPNKTPSSGQPHNNHRRRRGQHIRGGTPTPEAIPEDQVLEEMEKKSTTEHQERPSSPGSLRARRTSHRRPAEDQTSESEEHERPPSPGSLRARRSSHRRNSGDQLNEIDEQERPPSPGSLRTRRSTNRRSNSAGELTEVEEQERPASPGSLRARRSSNRRLSDDQILENDETERASSPGSLRHKRSQHRRSNEDPSLESAEMGNAQGSPGALRSRKTSQRRGTDDGSQHKRDGSATTDEARNGRPVSMSNLGKPPTNPSRRRLPRGSSENKIASGTSKSDIEQELWAIVRNPSSESKTKDEGNSEGKASDEVGVLPKTKAPSLAESLERGSLDKMLFNDGQYSVITEGSEMIVKGNISYSAIRSDASVAAPQLVFNPEDVNSGVQVKNV